MDRRANQNGSLLYTSPFLYHWLMRLLYGRHFDARYRIVAAEVPAGCSVVDVCAGDSFLYLHYLKQKSVHYTAVDNSPFFLQAAKKRGIACLQANALLDPIPGGDVVIMMASLYQFIPDERKIVEKLIRSARQKLILSEPVSNITSSHVSFLSRLANRLTMPFDPSSRYTGERFDEERLVTFLSSFEAMQQVVRLPGGREMVAVLKGGAG
jgi:hypothetical protein